MTIRSLRLNTDTILDIGESAGEQELAKYLQDLINTNKKLEENNADSADLKQKLESAEKQVATITAERDAQQARADMAEQKLTDIESTNADEDAIKQAFENGKARAALEKQVAEITGTEVKADESDRTLKIAAIAAKLKADASSYEGKSDAYVDAAFDLAMATDVTGLQRAAVNTSTSTPSNSGTNTDAGDMPTPPEKKKLRYSKANC